jgi:hypothetical protein
MVSLSMRSRYECARRGADRQLFWAFRAMSARNQGARFDCSRVPSGREHDHPPSRSEGGYAASGMSSPRDHCGNLIGESPQSKARRWLQ